LVEVKPLESDANECNLCRSADVAQLVEQRFRKTLRSKIDSSANPL